MIIMIYPHNISIIYNSIKLYYITYIVTIYYLLLFIMTINGLMVIPKNMGNCLHYIIHDWPWHILTQTTLGPPRDKGWTYVWWLVLTHRNINRLSTILDQHSKYRYKCLKAPTKQNIENLSGFLNGHTDIPSYTDTVIVDTRWCSAKQLDYTFHHRLVYLV